jgi:hypothetical protein
MPIITPFKRTNDIKFGSCTDDRCHCRFLCPRNMSKSEIKYSLTKYPISVANIAIATIGVFAKQTKRHIKLNIPLYDPGMLITCCLEVFLGRTINCFR